MLNTPTFKESFNRPAWTSTESTGMWEAYKHLHLFNKLKKYYFENKRGR